MTTHYVEMMVSTRMTASERRTAVLAAAITRVRTLGLRRDVHRRHRPQVPGISQPYLFRLFGTKKDLFMATYELVADRIIAAMTRAGTGARGRRPRRRWVSPTWSSSRIPSCSRSSCTDSPPPPGIPRHRRHVPFRIVPEVLWHLIHERTEMSDEEILKFFAMGMMLNVMSAIDLLSVPEHWAQSFCPTPEKITAIQAASQAIKEQRSAELNPTEEVSA